MPPVLNDAQPMPEAASRRLSGGVRGKVAQREGPFHLGMNLAQ